MTDARGVEAQYAGLRAVALRCSLEFCKLNPDCFADGRIFGLVMDFRIDDDQATFFCCYKADEGKYVHLALYTSAGFGIIGERFPKRAFDAGRRFLKLANDCASRMRLTSAFPWAAAGQTQFFAFTSTGVLTAETSETNLDALVNAGHSVLVEMYKVLPRHHEDGSNAGRSDADDQHELN